MTRPEIHLRLSEKMEAEWGAYRQAVQQLPAVSVFSKADEIHAARLCYEELVYHADAYLDSLLERLLALPDPLETIRERWMDEQDRDPDRLYENLEQVLRNICAQENTPQQAGNGGSAR